MQRTGTAACLLLFSLFCLTGLMAQTTQWGTPRFHSSLRSSNESVYANNLDGTISIPIISKPGRGKSFYLTRVYNSAIYTGVGQFQPVGTQPSSSSSLIPYWGWLTQSPAGTFAWQTHTSSCLYRPPQCPSCTYYATFYVYDLIFYEPNGHSHSFTNLGISTPNPCHAAQYAGSGSDAEGWTAYGDIQTYNNTTVTSPDGTVYHHSGSVEDTNGNEISQSNPSSSESDFYDTTGLETAKVVTATNCVNPVDGKTYPQCVSYEALEPGSTSIYATVYTEYDENLSVNSGSCANLSAYTGTAAVPAYGVLGQYTSGSHWYYTFSYDVAGRVSAITYPTGGTTSWSYGSLCTFGDGGPDSVTKTVKDNDGTVLSTITLTRASGQTTETVQDGSSHLLRKQVVTYDTSSGLPTDEKDYATDGTTVLKEVSWSNTASYPQVVTTKLNGTPVSEADLSFDSYGNLHQRVVKDLARDSSGATQQITTINYLNTSAYTNLNIIDKPTDETVTNFNGTVLAKTTINYDNYASGIAVSGDPEHDSAYGTSYTTRANPTSIVREVASAATLTTSFDYNDAGQVIATHDPNGNTVTTTYNSAVCGGVYPASQQAPGGSISTTYDCGTGLLAQTQDQNGATASAQYDTLGRLTQATAADGGVTTYSYDDPNNTKVASSIDGSSWLTRYQVSDGYGRPIYAQTQAPSNWDTVETVYDGLGRVAEVSNPYNTTHAPAAGTQFTTTSYDGLGRPLQITAVDGSHTTYAYSQNAVQVTDAKGVQKVLQNDGLGHLWKVCEVSGQSGSAACGTVLGANGFLTTYTYDMAGRLTGVNQNGQTRSWSFDELGRTLSQADPESGTTSYTYDSSSDAVCQGTTASAGDLVLVSDGSGDKTCFHHDAWHRVTAKLFSTGQSYTYTWDGGASGYLNGRLASAAAPSTSTSFSYDALGRPLAVTESPSGLAAETTHYSYNYLGETTAMTAPSGKVTNYSYDAKARLVQAADSGGLKYVDGRVFNAGDQITAQTFGDTGTSHAMALTASYNNVLQPWQLSYTPAAGSPLTLQYQWGASIDTGGNVTSADNNGTVRAVVDATNGNRTLRYTYDDLNRIASAVQADSTINASFSIDPQGTLYNTTFTDNTATNRLNGLGYDGAGRVLSGSWGGVSSRAFTWDPEGKMLTYSDQNTSTITYSYDAFGRRVMAQQTGSTTRYWLYGTQGGDHPVAEYSGAWQTNIEVEGTTVATVDSANNVTYVALSMLKTAKMTVNGAGSASGVATYNPYGIENASITAEFKFTNQIRDPNGIDHFWMRSYSATLGRWLTPDPAGLAAVDPSNPQSWNRYAYVLNNPTSAFDPLGLTCYVANGSTSPMSQADCIDTGNTWSEMVDGGLQVEAGGGSVPYFIAVLQADGSSQWKLEGGSPIPGSGDGGGGGSTSSATPEMQKHQTRPQCAAEFGDKYSIAGVFGISDKSVRGFLLGAVAGNTISGLVEHFQSSPGKLYGDLALGGLGQGIPTGTLAGDGVIGTVAGKIGSAVARSRTLLSIVGDATEAGAEDSLAGPLGIAKLAADLGVFGLGYYLCPK